MSDHTNVRIETTDGTVVAYLAPNFEITPTLKNDLFAQDVTDGKTVARDNQIVRHEIVAQGAFEHSDSLRSAHASALTSLFGKSPVTARDQVNRIEHYMKYEGGPFHFYEGSDEYTATTQDSVDVQASPAIKPVVQLDEFRPPSEAGLSRFEYMIKMVVGVPR